MVLFNWWNLRLPLSLSAIPLPPPVHAYTLTPHLSGLSLVAARDVQPGEQIISENPLIVLPTSFGLSLEGVNNYIVNLLESGEEEHKKQFLELSHVAGVEEGLLLEARIVKTNAIGIGNDKIAVFANVSRINHDCLPNCVFIWRESQKRLVVHALRKIPVGEELTLPYVPALLSFSERQAQLARRYNFTCTCARCSRSPVDRNISDERMREYARLSETVGSQWPKGAMSGTEAIEHFKKMLKILELEEVLFGRGQIARDAIQVAAGHSDYTAVRYWAKKAIEWFSLELGVDSEEVAQFIVISRDPKIAAGWGARETESLQV